jgi:phage gp29-like protein
MKILTLGSLLRTDPSAVVTRPNAPTAKTAEAPMRDDFGRENRPTASPLIGGMLQPRVFDRYHSIAPPWKPEDIVSALLDAERGDMTRMYDLMEHMEDRDGALLGFMQTRRLAPCGLKMTIEAADDSKEAEAAAEMVRAEIKGIPKFRIAFRKMTDAIGKGMSVNWIDWQMGGRAKESIYRINGIHHINPKRYRFDWRREELRILPDLTGLDDAAVKQLGGSVTEGIPILPWKAIIHKTEVKSGHPAKVGVLRNVVFDFLARNYAVKDFIVYCDIFGMPIRLGRYPEGASDEDKLALAEAMENLGTDAAAIVSKLVEIELLESKGKTSGQIPYAELHKLCEHNMQMAILGQDQTNTHNAAGGRTQVAEGGAKVRQDLLEADCIDLEETLTAQLCYPIVGFSQLERPRFVRTVDGSTVEEWPVADAVCPKVKLHYEPPVDEESYAAVDTVLINVLGLPQTHGQLAKRYNRELPEGVDPHELVKPMAAQQIENAASIADQRQQDRADAKGGKKKSFARQLTAQLVRLSTGLQQQDPIDDLADRAIDEDPQIPLVNAVAGIVEGSESLPELQERLRRAFDDLDATELERLVRRTTFVARLHGRVAARKE